MKIAGYARISVDLEVDKDNTSIENQKSIIREYVNKFFPDDELLFFEDRDRSGYTFEQRESYQQMRAQLMSGDIKVLIVKDFSRFARRNSKGLVELEDLRDAGVRIISIGDSIDYPTSDEWMQIQFRFLINEMPVTDASRKVKTVIKRLQQEGQWINTVPYGYVITNQKKNLFEIVPDEAEVVRKIYELYTDEGWGYKKIANYLTESGIPTPRMKEKERIEARGDSYKRQARKAWSIISVQGILDNDFYIGTLRQHKYKRKNINGADIKVNQNENYVFENHHEPIIDMRMWMRTKELRVQRTTTHYRGVKKYPTVYSGLLFCGDCGEPMFSMSRRDLKPAYVCGRYHKRGVKACTSHHIRVETLDVVVKEYISLVKENSSGMIKELEKALKKESNEIKENDTTLSYLEQLLVTAKQELKTTKSRKIKEITRLEMEGRSSEYIETVEDSYQQIEDELVLKISGLKTQLLNVTDKRNDIIRVNRLARTVIDVFDDIIKKPSLDKTDLQLIVDKILVYTDRIEIKLKADIDALLHCNAGGKLLNFDNDTKVIKCTEGLKISSDIGNKFPETTGIIRVKARNQPEELFSVNVISSGDPLEIFTDREGEIILKKYSPIGELGTFAKQYADTLAQTTGCTVCITDRDQVIAAAGGVKKDMVTKAISKKLDDVIEGRSQVIAQKGEKKFVPFTEEDSEDFENQVISPIICEGDAIGAVVILGKDPRGKMGETEQKLAASAAGFLGKQMES